MSFFLITQLNARKYHVTLNGSDMNSGNLSSPLRTILTSVVAFISI